MAHKLNLVIIDMCKHLKVSIILTLNVRVCNNFLLLAKVGLVNWDMEKFPGKAPINKVVIKIVLNYILSLLLLFYIFMSYLLELL